MRTEVTYSCEECGTSYYGIAEKALECEALHRAVADSLVVVKVCHDKPARQAVPGTPAVLVAEFVTSTGRRYRKSYSGQGMPAPAPVKASTNEGSK